LGHIIFLYYICYRNLSIITKVANRKKTEHYSIRIKVGLNSGTRVHEEGMSSNRQLVRDGEV
jgi:hypothetical protein